MDSLSPEAIFTDVVIVPAWINQNQPQRPQPLALWLSLCKHLQTSPPSPQPGSSGLTFTTLDTRTPWRAYRKHLSFRKVQMMSTASLTCLRKSSFGRRRSSMNLSRDLAGVSLSPITTLGTGDPEAAELTVSWTCELLSPLLPASQFSSVPASRGLLSFISQAGRSYAAAGLGSLHGRSFVLNLCFYFASLQMKGSCHPTDLSDLSALSSRIPELPPAFSRQTRISGLSSDYTLKSCF